jgi:hypothetical protein
MNTGWTVQSWDREHARGVIVSHQLGELVFDGAASLVTDFRIGEAVEVELESRAEGFHVKRIWPDDPRFVPRGDLLPSAPPLRADIAERTATALAKAPAALDFRVASLGGDLLVRGDDDAFAYGHRAEIRFRGVEYIELPTRWGGKTLTLADDTERRYLAGRTDISETTVAVRIVDAARRIYFLTCEAVETMPTAG